jgi:hypothetical protein
MAVAVGVGVGTVAVEVGMAAAARDGMDTWAGGAAVGGDLVLIGMDRGHITLRIPIPTRMAAQS